MNQDITITTGVIGWSNKRTGVEIYEDTQEVEGKWPRWLPRQAGSDSPENQEWGRLLGDKLGDQTEGSSVVVVVLPRGDNKRAEQIVHHLASAIRQSAGEDG